MEFSKNKLATVKSLKDGTFLMGRFNVLELQCCGVNQIDVGPSQDWMPKMLFWESRRASLMPVSYSKE